MVDDFPVGPYHFYSVLRMLLLLLRVLLLRHGREWLIQVDAVC